MGQSSSQLDPPDLTQLETDYGRSVSPTPALSESDGKADIKRDEAESGGEGFVEETATMDTDRAQFEESTAQRTRSSPINRRDVYEVPGSSRYRSSRKISKTPTPSGDKHVIDECVGEAGIDSNRPHKRQKKAYSSQAAAAQVQVPASQPLPSAAQQPLTSDTNTNTVSSRKLAASAAVIPNPRPEPQVVMPASDRQQAVAEMVSDTQDALSQLHELPLQDLIETVKKRKKRKRRQSAEGTNARDATVMVRYEGEDQDGPAPTLVKVRDQNADRERKKARKKNTHNSRLPSGRGPGLDAAELRENIVEGVSDHELHTSSPKLRHVKRRSKPAVEPNNGPSTQNMLERTESGLGCINCQADSSSDAEANAVPARADDEEDVRDLQDPAEDKQGEDGVSGWPTSEDSDVQALLNDQDWLASRVLLQTEHVPKDPHTERDKQIRIVIKARNKLRAHYERLLYERKLFKGMAREVQDENGTLYAEYAESGTRFEIPERSAEEKKAAKKQQKSMKRLRQSLLESLAQSQVESQWRAAEETAQTRDFGKPVDGRDDGYKVADDMEDVRSNEAVIRIAAERTKQGLEAVMAADTECVDQEKSSREHANEVVEELTQRNMKEVEQKEKQTKKSAGELVEEPTQRNKQYAENKAKRTRKSDPVLQGPGLADAVVPTPSSSKERRHKYSALKTEGHGSQVTSWLAGQDGVPQASAHELPELLPTLRKRKRQSTFRADDDEEYAEEAPAVVASEESNSATTSDSAKAKIGSAEVKKRADMPPPSKPTRKSTQSGTAPDRHRTVTWISGPFDSDEKARADYIFANVMHRENISRAELVAQIKDWKNATVFKADIIDAFPERSSAAVRKFCQRRYHDQERGPWTEQQDELLRKAYACNPDKWSVISQNVGRTGADCKDRWTKQLQYRERDTGPWSLEQEQELLAAVKECLKVIKTEKKNDRDLVLSKDRLEALINWKVVSEKLGGRRAADKCREKYQRLRMAKARDENADDNIDSTNIPSASVQAKEASKLAAARNTVNNTFEIGDFYDVFVEVHTSFAHHDQHFRHERNVLWSIVSGKNIHSRFALYYNPGALRRAALEKAIEEWPQSNAKIRKRLDKVDTMPAKALVLANWIEREFNGRLDSMKRTFKTEMIGKSEQEVSRIKQERKEKHKKRHTNRVDLSRDYITDSDDEVRDDEVNNPVPSPVREHQSEDIDAEPQSSGLEDVDAEPQSSKSEESSSNVGREIPESQIQTAQSPARDEDVPMTDVESLDSRPNIAPGDFVERLKSSGSGRRRRAVGYGKKERGREETQRRKTYGC